MDATVPSLERSNAARIGAVVVAAGLSSRMGQFKPLMVLDDRPLLAHAIGNLQAVGELRPFVVVSGHRGDEVRDLVDDDPWVNVVHNGDYAAGGMLSSVQAGVRAVAGKCDAFLVALGDHPLVRPETVALLLGAAWVTGAGVVKPVYRGRGGHPVLIDSRLADAILGLPPEATLKTFMQSVSGRTAELVVDDPGVVMDVDTPEDYRAAEQLYFSRNVRKSNGQSQQQMAIGV
jgi:CTP:molybdopterin cytidylyltransferase MocA